MFKKSLLTPQAHPSEAKTIQEVINYLSNSKQSSQGRGTYSCPDFRLFASIKNENKSNKAQSPKAVTDLKP